MKIVGMLVLMIFTISSLGASSKKVKKEDKVTVKLKVKKEQNNFIASLEICNQGEGTYFLNPYDLFYEKILIRGFRVEKDNQEVDFIGRKYKMKSLKYPDEYIKLDKRDCHNSNGVLSDYFDFSKKGKYLIIYNGKVTKQTDRKKVLKLEDKVVFDYIF